MHQRQQQYNAHRNALPDHSDLLWGGGRYEAETLFSLTDDPCYDTLGCAGCPIVQTPVIDGLAAREEARKRRGRK
jgi:hypothetical protein